MKKRQIFISIISTLLAFKAQANQINIHESITLPSVIVTTQSEKNDGYNSKSSLSVMRTNTALLDTPQSVAVVTQDQIRDQNITKMGEAIRYTPGVSLHQGENNRDQVVIRGNSTSADFFIDGARDDVQYFRDFYNMDRIEILKGPNALAFGRGGSGGLINRISKTADGSRVREVVVSGGSYGNRRVQADVGDKVNDIVAVRLNGMYEQSGTFRQHGDLERYGINPTVTFKLGKDTRLLAGYEYFHDARFNDRGIPSQNGLPYKTDPKTFFGNPNENHADVTVNSGYATLEHNFTPTLKLKNYTRYTENDKFYKNAYAGSPVDAAGNLALAAYNNALKRDTLTNQTDLTKKFTTGSLEHTALLGMEITRQDSEAFRNTGFFDNANTTVKVPAVNPVSFAPITYSQNATDADNHSEVRVYAGYLQDQIDINKYLQVTGGLRFDSFKFDYHNNRNGQDLSRTDNMISPRAGIVVKPIKDVSIYGNYNVSFLPSSGDQFSALTVQTAAFKPESLDNKEIGVKWDINPSLNVSAAIYELNRTNTKAVDPTNPNNIILTGKTRTRGVELGATGKITDKWQIIAAYAYQDAIVKNSIASGTTPISAGNTVALVPNNMASLWNKYDFTPEFAAAVGVINQSAQYANVDNTVKLKGFTRFDAAVYCTINPSYRIQLNVENLLDREYFSTADGNNNLQPGSPQAFKVSVTAKF